MPLFRTFCPRCKRTIPGLMREVPAALAFRRICLECGKDWVGVAECPQCHITNAVIETSLDPQFHVPAQEECAACKREMTVWKAEVGLGGAYFRCRTCWAEGVIPRLTALALHIRGLVKPPLEVRCELEYCPKCKPESPEGERSTQ